MKQSETDKRILKGQQARLIILNSAIEIIANEGIRDISAAKIAKATGMSKSNIFHHFKTKDDIIIGVHDIVFAEFSEAIDELYPSLEEFLLQLGSIFLESPSQYNIYKAFISFYHEGLFNSEYNKALSSSTQNIILDLKKQFRRYVPQSIGDSTLNTVAMLTLSTLDGLVLHYLLKGKADNFHTAWKLQVEMLCKRIEEGL